MGQIRGCQDLVKVHLVAVVADVAVVQIAEVVAHPEGCHHHCHCYLEEVSFGMVAGDDLAPCCCHCHQGKTRLFRTDCETEKLALRSPVTPVALVPVLKMARISAKGDLIMTLMMAKSRDWKLILADCFLLLLDYSDSGLIQPDSV